ncbi:MAG: 3-isopropylmalate dehydratase small subunit [Candidatus Eremiobacteraeota bacterium]|nr:3-isopropylmalate dehydratase small subunit [Candidatus Eremiobacteraeota bacterium]
MIVESRVLALPRANVDTDQVFPGKYLSLISREGFGEKLFEGMPGGRELLASKPGARIIVVGDNFGCGSSREHAVWALVDYGFKAIVAPSLARIFHENAYNNGLVPVIVRDPQAHAACLAAERLSIDVANETIRAEGCEIARFELDPLKKEFLLRGGFMEYLASKVDTVRAWTRRRVS